MTISVGRVVFSIALITIALMVACSSLGCSSSAPADDDGSTRRSGKNESPAGRAEVRQPFEPHAAARAALVITSCTTNMPAEYRLVDMYATFHPLNTPDETGALARCIDERRNGCRALDDCLAMTIVTSQGHPTQCDGNVAQSDLGISTSVRVDCTRLGRTCVVIGSIAECIDSSTATCTDHPAQCDPEGRPLRCRGGRLSLGLPCSSVGDGIACMGDATMTYCGGMRITNGGACTNRSPPVSTYVRVEGEVCEGEMLSACIGGGRALVDCRTLAIGTSCQSKGNGDLAYCGLGTECDPNKPATTECDGNLVTVCNAGRLERIDCKRLGFTSCVAALSSRGDRYARCF